VLFRSHPGIKVKSTFNIRNGYFEFVRSHSSDSFEALEYVTNNQQIDAQQIAINL
jgi:hypothetical protein